MAHARRRRSWGPGRSLLAFLAALAAVFGGLALNGDWTPELGLDLQGGTRITLQADTATGEEVTEQKISEAADIIDSRVNASGVAESEVSTQGGRNIVVEIPGKQRKDLVDTVSQTAQLRFRLVAAAAPGTPAPETPAPDDSAEPGGGTGEGEGDSGNGGGSGGNGGNGEDGDAEPRGRALSDGLLRAGGSGPGGEGQEGGQDPEPSPTPDAVEVPTDESSIEELLAWSRNPDTRSLQRFQQFTCADTEDSVDNPGKPLLACDPETGEKLLLSPAVIEGTELDDASFGIPQGQANYVVNLDFDGGATDVFAEVTRALAGTGQRFAIVLDLEVLSAPTVTNPITNGDAEISGNFTESSARSLANSLKYGALPLQFEVLDVTEEGPTLAGAQLEAGLLAGAVGMALVLVYCLLYYRGLGTVVVASLAVAAATTYAAVLVLSETAGFTLTLPGIAGLIVAVGITADSFIVYFERIRDEMREGKSLRVAVEAGWVRARTTCLAADAVSLIAALVLYLVAVGVVKGFAFALGISTLIDLLVFFLFTKPMVTWLARFDFFKNGHRLSGVSPDHVGIERIGSTRPRTRPAAARSAAPAEGATR